MSRFDALDIGLVVATHGRHVMIETPEGRRMLCHPRGKKSDIVFGDRVRWQPAGDEGVVEHTETRRNLLFRQDEWRSKSFAANLDQLIMLVASEPVFSERQLTRALIAASQADIPTLIGLNKTDLPAVAAARERLLPYTKMGVEVIDLAIKAEPAESLAKLQPRLAGKTTLVIGPSGAGKSTLVNLLVPQAAAQIGEISVALGTGRHTTTSTTWYWLDDQRSGALIDSPGFQEFGLRQIEATALAGLMPDIAAHLGQCRFNNCTHRQEPACGVRAALADEHISESRYRIYQELFDELTTRSW